MTHPCKYPARSLGRLSSVILVGTMAALSAGCGLSHYQDQMAVEQARVDGLEAEPLQLPKKKTRPPVFFRPPKGINSIGFPLEGSLLHRFAVKSGAISLFADVALGAETMKDADFWAALLRSFPGKERKDFQPMKREASNELAFEESRSEDSQYVTFVDVYTSGENHVVIVFRLDRSKATDKNAEQIRRWSLGTLTVGAEAARLQQAYEARKTNAALAAKRRQASQGEP